MGFAMDLCAQSLGTTMEALQQASLLCERCPEAAAAQIALSHAEQLMAATNKKVRLTLRLAVTIKQQQNPAQQQQQQQQQQLPWGCTGADLAMPPPPAAAAAAPHGKIPPAAAPAAADCDPSTADSACSGSAGQLALPQFMQIQQQGGFNMQLLHGQEQQQQQLQQHSQQCDAQRLQQGSDAQEEVASSWE
jgi:hypothetical protein